MTAMTGRHAPMSTKAFFPWVALTTVLLAACHGSSSPSNVGVVTSGTTLAIALSTDTGTTTVLSSGQLTITATLINDASSQGVTWALQGPGALSNITTTSVVYTGPSRVVGNEFATITATSITDTSQASSVTVTTNGSPTIPQPVLFPGNQNISYVGYINVAGGAAPFTWSVVAGALPNGLSLSTSTGASVAIVGKPTSTGTSNFTVQAVDYDGLVATVNLSLTINNQTACLLNGQYAYQLTGFLAQKPAVRAGTFVVDSQGNVAGQYDLKNGATAQANQTLTSGGLCQTYTQNFGALPMSSSYANELFDYATGQSLSSGHMQQNDGTSQLMGGWFTQQDSTSFHLSSVAGDWVFGLVGDNGSLTRLGFAGRLSVNAQGLISQGAADSTAGIGFASSAVTGTLTAPDATTGRGTMTLTIGSQSYPFAYYVIDANRIWVVSNDTGTSTPRLAGQLSRQAGAGLLDATQFNTPGVMSLWGMRYVQNSPAATVALMRYQSTAPGVLTITSDVVAEGAYDVYNNTSAQPATMTANGRGTIGLTIGTSSRLFVVYSDGHGGGYVVEPGSLVNNYGIIRPQTIFAQQNTITTFNTTYYLGGTVNAVATAPITNLAQLLIGQGSVSGAVSGYYVLDPTSGRMAFSASRLVLGGADVVGYVLDQQHLVLMGDSLSSPNSQIAWIEAY